MEPKLDSLVCDRLIPGLGTPGVPGWGPVPLCVFVVVRRSPGLCGVAMRAATRCARPRSRPRRPACAPRRTEAIRHGQGWLATGGGTGTSHSHAGCCREVPSSTGTGRADSGYRRDHEGVYFRGAHIVLELETPGCGALPNPDGLPPNPEPGVAPAPNTDVASPDPPPVAPNTDCCCVP